MSGLIIAIIVIAIIALVLFAFVMPRARAKKRERELNRQREEYFRTYEGPTREELLERMRAKKELEEVGPAR